MIKLIICIPLIIPLGWFNTNRMAKRAHKHSFGRSTSKDDTPGDITGGIPKRHLAELSARHRLDWNGSQ
jgi:hypothetical protein